MSTPRPRPIPLAASLAALDARGRALIENTRPLLRQTREQLLLSAIRMERQQRGFGCATLILRADPAPEFVDVESVDPPDLVTILNELEDACSYCGSCAKTLVALVRIPAFGVEMALCGECSQDLFERALGQVV